MEMGEIIPTVNEREGEERGKGWWSDLLMPRSIHGLTLYYISILIEYIYSKLMLEKIHSTTQITANRRCFQPLTELLRCSCVHILLSSPLQQ